MVQDKLVEARMLRCSGRSEDSYMVLGELLHHAQVAHVAILAVQEVGPEHHRNMRTVQAAVNAEVSR